MKGLSRNSVTRRAEASVAGSSPRCTRRMSVAPHGRPRERRVDIVEQLIDELAARHQLVRRARPRVVARPGDGGAAPRRQEEQAPTCRAADGMRAAPAGDHEVHRHRPLRHAPPGGRGAPRAKRVRRPAAGGHQHRTRADGEGRRLWLQRLRHHARHATLVLADQPERPGHGWRLRARAGPRCG